MVSRSEQKIRRVNLPVQHHRLGGLKHADAFLLIATDQGLQHSYDGASRDIVNLFVGAKRIAELERENSEGDGGAMRWRRSVQTSNTIAEPFHR